MHVDDTDETNAMAIDGVGLEVEYEGPSIKKPDATAAADLDDALAAVVTFIGPDGALYNSLYRKVSPSAATAAAAAASTTATATATAAAGTGMGMGMGGSGLCGSVAPAPALASAGAVDDVQPFVVAAGVYSAMPRPDAFDSFEAFDQALCHWRSDFTRRLGMC
jgi:hypothetical protein